MSGSTAQIGRRAARRADAELERLRRRLEPARLVGAEAVLAGEHDGEAPAAGRRAPRLALDTRERDVAGDRRCRGSDRAERVPAASTKRWPKPWTSISRLQAEPRVDRVVARPRNDAAVDVVAPRLGVDVDVDQLRADGRAEGRREVARLHAERDAVGPAVVDLEPLEVVGARVEVVGVGYSYVPGPLSSPSGSVSS